MRTAANLTAVLTAAVAIAASGCNPVVVQSDPAPVESPAPAAPVAEEVVKAGVGVGKKGNSYDKFTAKAVATPAKALFNAKEKVVFEIQIPHAVNLYAQLHGGGKGPQSHEEFMQKIIKEQRIELPELPDGHTYEWDVEQQILMVRRPGTE